MANISHCKTFWSPLVLFEVVPANCRQTIIDIEAPVQMSQEDTERDIDPSAIGGASNEVQQITEELKRS